MRTALVLALALTAVAPTTAGACVPGPAERVLAEGPRAVLYSRPFTGDDTANGQALRACLRSTGRSMRLAGTGSDEGGGTAFVAAAFAGRFVAVVRRAYTRSGTESSIAQVVDLRARRTLVNELELTVGSDERSRVLEVAVGTRGHLAAVTTDGEPARLVAWAAGRELVVVPSGAVSGIRFDGATLRWTQEGAPRSRALPAIRR
jgi:hypothetical protein